LRRVVKEKLGKKAVFPGFIKPALAEQLSRPPKGEGLQKEIRAKRSDKLVLYAFDLLYLNGNDLRGVPIEDRKARLRDLIRNTDILFSESFEADGATIFAHACEMGIEGIVSKRAGSRYRSGRTNDWIKSTCRQRETLAIVGYALKENRFDGLYLGRPNGDDLEYAGKVDHGFSGDQVSDLQAKFKRLMQKSQAFTKKVAKPKAVWLKPVLLAEIEYRAESAQRKAAPSVLQGLRDDL
jgi:bifunctional non-homologous end joining protein LigD